MNRKLTVFLLIIVLVAAGIVVLQQVRAGNEDSQSTPSSATSQGIVTGAVINFAGKGLSTVPSSTFKQTRATQLDISNNNLTGSLPGELRLLTNLEVLNASNNKMTGIPAEIGQLSRLRTANFAHNDLSGLPLEIGNLTQLQTLDLRGNPHISKVDIGKIQSKIPSAKILVD